MIRFRKVQRSTVVSREAKSDGKTLSGIFGEFQLCDLVIKWSLQGRVQWIPEFQECDEEEVETWRTVDFRSFKKVKEKRSDRMPPLDLIPHSRLPPSPKAESIALWRHGWNRPHFRRWTENVPGNAK
ncbi:hypothetical protein TNCV_3849331 [Trichonephila clavipes]|uniref:Uncharacterized protein n=1 Tax=Trichonephila clavipes TaxID=2585209 RepID=A0A8X6UWF7_TRICX|nr:hypothetical protein TNCV_3849331 [Trichonephila clavipes]